MTDRRDRALGVVLGGAAGDALGAPYEFEPAVLPPEPIRLKAGGQWERGEWTDDTAMAVPILRAISAGRSLADPATLGGIVAEWERWHWYAKDVGIQTGHVLSHLAEPTEVAARAGARAAHEANGRSGGNGSLMRTSVIALAGGDAADLAAAARRVSDLTHYEPDNADACVLWTLAVAHAIDTGRADPRVGLGQLPADRRDRWEGLLADAEAKQPWEFTKNGWVVQALQAAWSAVSRTDSLPDALVLAVRTGNDTDTVAAIAGGLAGAVHGAAGVPAEWRGALHGWFAADRTGRADDLLGLAAACPAAR